MAKRRRRHLKKQKKYISPQVSEKQKTFFICMALALVTVTAYWPVLAADFVNFDDDTYITSNQHVLDGLTLNGAKWAFSMDGYAANFHPLTWLSHMLDCELFGTNAGLHHLTNLIIHTLSTVILLLVLNSMTGRIWASAFVAAAFAIHPLHVESVAWIAERKDVLSGLFWMLTMVCYLGYRRKGGWDRYLLTLVVFALGLMAKPMLVTLPFVLLLLDYWPLERFDSGPKNNRLKTARFLVIEKIPFLALTAASCVVTYIAQKAGDAVLETAYVPFKDRLLNAFVSYKTYIGKMFWPADLATLYPLKQIASHRSLAAFLLLTVITVAVIFWGRKKRYLAVGWLWYVGTLIPVIGLVQVGAQSHADRYTYIPLIGLLIIVAWAAGDFCRKFPGLRFISFTLTILLISGMFGGTRNQLGYWKNSISLFSRSVQVTENNSVMHYNLGLALDQAGQTDESIVHYNRVLQIDPEDVDTRYLLAIALSKKNQLEKAIAHLKHILKNNPDHAGVHSNLGNFLTETGQLDNAIAHYRHALKINPDAADVHKNLSFALARAGQIDTAIIHCRRALQINPDDPANHYNLGNALGAMGQLDEAATHYRNALQINPNDADVHNNLGIVLASAAKLNEAINHFRRAVQIDPGNVSAQKNLDAAMAILENPKTDVKDD